jgi:hypothetical protein
MASGLRLAEPAYQTKKTWNRDELLLLTAGWLGRTLQVSQLPQKGLTGASDGIVIRNSCSSCATPSPSPQPSTGCLAVTSLVEMGNEKWV